MLNNVKRGIVILLSLCLAALAGCSLAYVDSADAKVSVTGEAEQLSLTLATAKGEVEYRSLSASGTGSFTFSSVYFGDYIVKAYGYEDLSPCSPSQSPAPPPHSSQATRASS